jgi:hypothetical protein
MRCFSRERMGGVQSKTLVASETSRSYRLCQVEVVAVNNLLSWRSTLDQVMLFSMVQVSAARCGFRGLDRLFLSAPHLLNVAGGGSIDAH